MATGAPGRCRRGHLGFSSYGSSFLFGPIEQDGARPVVNIREIEFDPKTISFKLAFKDGSTGTLKLDSVDENRMVLDALLDRPVTGGKGLRRAALDVCHRVQQRRRPHRHPRARRQGLARGAADAVHAAARRPTSGWAAPPIRATTPPRPTWSSAISRRTRTRRRSRGRSKPGAGSTVASPERIGSALALLMTARRASR